MAPSPEPGRRERGRQQHSGPGTTGVGSPGARWEPTPHTPTDGQWCAPTGCTEHTAVCSCHGDPAHALGDKRAAVPPGAGSSRSPAARWVAVLCGVGAQRVSAVLQCRRGCHGLCGATRLPVLPAVQAGCRQGASVLPITILFGAEAAAVI